MPIGAIANSENGSIVCAPGGRLRLALLIRSLSRISGEFEIIVMLVPARMQNAIGNNRRLSGTPVRAETRLVTGTNSAASAWLWMIDDIAPAIALMKKLKRDSTPLDKRKINDAALFNTPVRSSPAPMIITPSSEITALPANPSNNCSTGIRRVMPITTTISSATRSARIHSSTSMSTVNASSPRTSSMSCVSVRPECIRGVFFLLARPLTASGAFIDEIP